MGVPRARDLRLVGRVTAPPRHRTRRGLVGAAAIVWWSIIGARRRQHYGASMLAVFLARLASTALGALLVFADRPLYTLPDSTVSGVAQRLADQQVAGVVMWAYGGVLTATGAMALFVAWIRDAERRTATSAVVLRSILPLAPVAAAVAVACTTLLSPPSGDAAATPSRPDPSGIYERDCAECHGSGGGGTAKGPAIAEEGAASIDYVVSTGRMPIEDPDDEINGPRGVRPSDDDRTRRVRRLPGRRRRTLGRFPTSTSRPPTSPTAASCTG